MDISIDESHRTESESPALLVSVGNAADLTLGEGGTGSESKRYEYN